MSRYDWEKGSIVIPSQEWVGFKKKIREAFNKRQDELYAIAERLQGTVIRKKKGDRTTPWDTAFHHSLPDSLTFKESCQIQRALFRNGVRERPLKPRKKDFEKATNRTTHFEVASEAGIHFDNETRTASWYVDENNRAVAQARDTPLGRIFFNALEAIGQRNGWTSRSGGEIVGNDEYNRDSEYAGGGSNYVTGEYGTHSNRKNQRQQRSYSRYGRYG